MKLHSDKLNETAVAEGGVWTLGDILGQVEPKQKAQAQLEPGLEQTALTKAGEGLVQNKSPTRMKMEGKKK